MSFVESFLMILLAYGLLSFLGLGLTLSCLPSKLRSYSFFISPAIGYVSFCFFTIWASALTNAPLLKTNWWTLCGLAGWAIIALVRYRGELPNISHAAKLLPMLLGVMAFAVFFPALHQGIDLYLGTANPDFYQSLSLHEALVRFQAKFWVKHSDLPLVGPFLEMYPAAFQARFGGVAYSVQLEQLFGITPRTALMTSIIAFLWCLPGTVYFFCNTVLEFDKKSALLSALLVAVAAPTTMSFVHTFIGQNSALAIFPLAIALIYLALRERSMGMILLSALVLNGMIWLYVMALPYVLVPFGVYGAIKIYRQGWRSVGWWPTAAILLVASSAAVHLVVFRESKKFFSDLFGFLGKMTQSHYYADFLTEEVFEYATGLTSYPLSQNMLFHSVSHSTAPILISIGIALAGAYFLSVRLWSKTAPQDAVFITLSLIATYVAVWVKYTFMILYGYASFKMSAWLQFLVVPFFGWYILKNWEVIQEDNQRFAKWRAYAIFTLLVPVYVGLNLASTLDYGLKSYGRDRIHGSLINSYGIAGNKDFNELPKALKPLVPTHSTIALGFGDSIENFWAAYYVDHSANLATILSHEEIPFEDAYLPDIHSRKYKDSLGQVQLDNQKFFHDGLADYYLLPGSKNLNTDIIDSNAIGQPLWNNNTFALYKKGDIHDLIRLGRGYYRAEHMDVNKLGYWWPETFRWSAEGGEIYHFMPLLPGKPYQVEFSAITGLGLASGKRIIELWHDGVKFDEVVVDGTARIVSKPYFPTEGVNRLILRVKEKVVLVPRAIGLWNRNLPRRSTPINILFSNIHIVNSSQVLPETFPIGKTVEAKDLFNKAKAFNGFDVDGWVRERGEFTANISTSIGKVSLDVLIPGNLGFSFPYKVQFILNGTPVERLFASPGEYTVDLDLPESSSLKTITVEIIPQASKRLAEGMEQRELIQSIRLSAVSFYKLTKVSSQIQVN